MPYRLERGEWPPVKTQTVRLYDVFLLGPAMLLAGLALRQSRPALQRLQLRNGAAAHTRQGWAMGTLEADPETDRRMRQHVIDMIRAISRRCKG
jgi:hypothetical protein